MNSNRILAAVLVLQGLILAGQWCGTTTYQSVAGAQALDGGGQRMAIVEELQAVNQKLERLITILERGDLQVSVVKSDDKEQPAKAK